MAAMGMPKLEAGPQKSDGVARQPMFFVKLYQYLGKSSPQDPNPPFSDQLTPRRGDITIEWHSYSIAASTPLACAASPHRRRIDHRERIATFRGRRAYRRPGEYRHSREDIRVEQK